MLNHRIVLARPVEVVFDGERIQFDAGEHAHVRDHMLSRIRAHDADAVEEMEVLPDAVADDDVDGDDVQDEPDEVDAADREDAMRATTPAMGGRAASKPKKAKKEKGAKKAKGSDA